MATIKFILSLEKKNVNGEAPIFAQYKHLDGKTLFSTGKRIEPKYWDKVQGKVKRHESASTLNKYLNKFSTRINDIVTNLQNKDIEPTHNRVKDVFIAEKLEKLPEAEFSRSIINQWTDYLNSRANSIKPQTSSNQRNSLEALQGWLKKERVESLRPEQFTLKHLTKYQDYLNECLASNTVAKRLKHLKAFLKYHQELGGKVGLNLNKIKYKETEGVKIYLTEEELESFYRASVSEINSIKVFRGGKNETIYVNLGHVQDMFILQCNTGLRISDLKRLDKNISRNKIVIKTKKTGIDIEIPINPTVREILEKYKYKLPQVTEQKFNDGIKAIYKICFPKNTLQVRKGNEFETIHNWELISSHDAIRTFITLSAERGVSVSSISKITGKSIPVLLKHYLSQSQKVAEKEMEKAWGSSPLRIAK